MVDLARVSVSCFLNDAADIYEMQRLMGAGACLFAIFLVPEIWKNRRNQAMEIEGAAYYSLRQVCMARILLFGFMDLLIVTAFAVSVAFTVRVSAQMFAVNFMIPFNVTGAICFRFLYCKRGESEYLAAAGCFLFMILWVFIISREEIYCKISGAVWCAALSMGNGVYGLLGVNGAGKTTLMRMLCTLTTPDCGTITWDGKDIFKMGASYRQILGYLPQDFGYYPYLTIYDYMMYIASIKGIRPAVAKKRTKELLKQVGLSDQKKQKMRNLSGGMVRRVGIAQAMLNDPKILILDEPTAGLDPNERIRFRNLISELAEERLVLLSTHIVSDVEFIANKIVLMKEGQCCFEGTSDEVIASMDKKVYCFVAPREQVDHYMRNYLVVNVKTFGSNTELRILSDHEPVKGACVEEATLEDAFLNYFGERAGESHA